MRLLKSAGRQNSKHILRLSIEVASWLKLRRSAKNRSTRRCKTVLMRSEQRKLLMKRGDREFEH